VKKSSNTIQYQCCGYVTSDDSVAELRPMELVVTQALKNAGCDEVVLAINYQPKASIIILLW